MVGFERPLAPTMRYMPPRPNRSASRPTNQRRCASLRVARTFRNTISSLMLVAFIQPGSHKTFYIVNVILRQRLSFLCGKSFGLRVAMKAACPCSAHAQNELSSGSGDASPVVRTSTISASSLRRLMTSPTRFRRTPSLVRTSLYSEMTSALTSHVKVASSIQSRRKDALGFRTARQALNPAMPATSTDVSMTPLGGLFRPANSNLRQSLLLAPVATDCLRDLRLGDAG